MQPYISAEVLQHAEEPVVLFVAIGTFPDTGDAEHRTALREEV